MKNFIKKTAAIVFTLITIFAPAQLGNLNTAQAAVTPSIYLTSADSNVKYQYIKLGEYPTIQDQPTTLSADWWPTFTTPCIGSGVRKTAPWLADNNATANVTIINGDDMREYRNCNSTYSNRRWGWQNGAVIAPVRTFDGGPSGGQVTPWLPPEIEGGWALSGALNWGSTVGDGQKIATNGICRSDDNASADDTQCSPYLTGQNTTDSLTDPAGRTTYLPVLWGQKHRYGWALSESDRDHYVKLSERLGKGTPDDLSAAFPYQMLSSGTTLFRQEFSLTEAQVDLLKSATLKVNADDFVNVWLDGVSIFSSTKSPAEPTNSQKGKFVMSTDNAVTTNASFGVGADVMGKLRDKSVTTHALAFQVSDKAKWSTAVKIKSASNAVGLSYSFQIAMNNTPAATTDCFVGGSNRPLQSTTPVTATFTASAGFKTITGWAATTKSGSTAPALTGPAAGPKRGTFGNPDTYYVDINGTDDNDLAATGRCTVVVKPTNGSSSNEVAP
jgi:hypothetical protein